MTPQKAIVSILGAATAGVIIGILIAPEKGADARKTLRETSGKLIDDLSHWFGEGKRFLDDLKSSSVAARTHKIEEVHASENKDVSKS